MMRFLKIDLAPGNKILTMFKSTFRYLHGAVVAVGCDTSVNVGTRTLQVHAQ